MKPPDEPTGRTASAYGDRIADIYDERRGPASESEIAFLFELARGGRVLELGIGTGRVAVPLAARGLEVHGIEASERLISRLSAKPASEGITVHVGDFRKVPIDGAFSLVFAVGDTLSMLDSQEEQLDCFRRVGQHLTERGAFVIEAANPVHFFSAPPVRLLSLDDDGAWLGATRHDPVRQWVEQAQIRIGRDETRVYPVSGRYASPSELDLMARLAGLRLQERWDGWERHLFTAASARYVAVYARSP